ncbi:class I SAM-dependent methyltransferase [Longirhabdus pacifica]|uniref:class I SAM-dependent methyltransferase n=1 Tax=Longirhabdus pacifica TaxID=2305227 RepID=UPI00100878C5|nr:class I SAM-dependent methyltransferase [Longirhabdus pacifica]
MIITTSYKAAKHTTAHAAALANQMDGSAVIRKSNTISQLMKYYQEEHVMVVEDEGTLKYYAKGHSPLFFHPNMAQLRISRMIKGETDPLVRAGDIREGDHVLDCTMGLASDTLVLSYAVGKEGKVTALESSAVIYEIMVQGMEHYAFDLEVLHEVKQNIHMVHMDYLEMLQSLADNSVDVVYFDPMFRTAMDQSTPLAPLRGIANASPLTLQAIQEAKRVARRRVVMKENKYSGEFARLGFEQVLRTYAKTAYGVME